MVVVTETLDASVAAAEQTEQFLRTFDLESDPASPEPSADGDAASGSFSCHSKDGLAETEYDFDAQCLTLPGEATMGAGCALMADFDGAAIAEEAQRHSNPRECIFEHCIKRVPNVDVKTERAISLQTAVLKLETVFSSCPGESDLHQHIQDERDLGADSGRAVIEAVIGTKSPLTVIKRANSLLSYLRWAAARVQPGELFFTEQLVWRYFQFLEANGDAATRASSCLSALRFAQHVLGFKGLSEKLLTS
eukprot:s4088_g11.t1